MRRLGGRARRIPLRDEALLVVIALLLIDGGVLASISATPDVRASVTWTPQGTGLEADLSVRAGLTGGDLRVSLLPGEATHRAVGHAVLALVDPRFPYGYGPSSDAMSDSAWVWLYLADLGAPASPPIGVSDASSLPAELDEHPNATLLVLDSGALPDSVLSSSSSILKEWVRAGGTLVWAGGPIGYEEGHVDGSGQYVSTNLGWEGQVDLLGFNLTDPTGDALANASGNSPSPVATALGLSYSFDGDGANVSELAAHGGYSFGFQTPDGPSGGPSARTSIAYVPIGLGGLLYFGGGTGAPGISEVPEGSEYLSQDIAVLLDLGYAPAPGVPATQVEHLGPFGSGTVQLALPNRSGGSFAVVTTRVPGSFLFLWSEQYGPAAATASSPRSRARSDPSGPADGTRIETGVRGGAGLVLGTPG
jgi:hypothetical protein